MNLSSRSQNILLVGVGYVGTQLAQLLLEAGHTVYGLCRTERLLPSGVQRIQADITQPSSLPHPLPLIDQIVYAVSPGARSEEAYRRAFVVGLSKVIALFPDARILFVSSSAVFGSSAGLSSTEGLGSTASDLLNEESPVTPTEPTAKQLFEAEELLSTSGRPYIIARASGIYGPGRTSLLSRLAHTPLEESEQSHWTNRIHRDDLAGSLAFFLARPELQGLYLTTDSCPSTLEDLQQWIYKQPSAWRAQLPPPPEQARARRSTASRRLSNQKLLDAGYRFLFPSFREGYTALFGG